MKKLDASTKKLIITICVYLALCVIVTVLIWPYARKLSVPANREAFQQWVQSLGIWGWLIVMLFMSLQIIIAFIPGGPVEVIAGALYGTWGGVLVCTVGAFIGSAAVFAISHRFGAPLVNKLFGEQNVKSFSFLHDNKKIEVITLILFLIPGLPKDILTYVAGISDIKMSSFLIISSLARIPATAMSTMLGSSVSDGNWITAIILFVSIAVICLLGIMFKDKIIGYCHTIGDKVKRKGK